MTFDLSHVLVAIFAAALGAWWARKRQRRIEQRDRLAFPPQQANSAAVGPAREAEAEMGTLGRIFSVIFTLIWLTGWSFGIFVAAREILSEPNGGQLFLIMWLIAAIIAWFSAVRFLIRHLFGKDVLRARFWH
ncbi:MAG: hypothetical protein AAGA70_12130 [Pseudomonadota bacterium]